MDQATMAALQIRTGGVLLKLPQRTERLCTCLFTLRRTVAKTAILSVPLEYNLDNPFVPRLRLYTVQRNTLF
jgi:hypothetical protein